MSRLLRGAALFRRTVAATTTRNSLRRISIINNATPRSLHTFLHRRGHHHLSTALVRNGASKISGQQTRAISYTFIPRLILRASTRLPVVIVGGAAASGVYVVSKVEEARNSIQNSLGEAWTTVNGVLTKAGGALGIAGTAVGESADEVRQFGSGVWSTVSSFLQGIMEAGTEGEQGSLQGQREEQQQRPPKKTPTPSEMAAAAAMAATLPVVVHAEDDEDRHGEDPTQDLMMLTKKLIEIRSILLSIDQKESLQLPAIVVVGSQSSGKSSVLEAVVGREFLPKGNNMVTRRPIELTLIHTPATLSNPHPKTFAEFPTIAPGQRILDFSDVQKKLLDMNLSIPSSQAVSSDPIELRIHSPNVPDLSLVDLLGYIEVEAQGQPANLKAEIAALCEKYIKAPNIVLAVCAADVDLANSHALTASRRVDPMGMRTIGVVTKMDLVDPKHGASILSNEKYPLSLGYIGVVCKAAAKSREGREVIHIRNAEDDGLAGPVKRQEQQYFGSYPEHFNQDGILVTTDLLKRRLMTVLEKSMANSLHSISNSVQQELEEARYQFKVQYNDRTVSPEGYLAETLDLLKHRIGEFKALFGKPKIKEILTAQLNYTAMNSLWRTYWLDTSEDGDMKNLSGVAAQVDELRARKQRNPDAVKGQADPAIPWKRKLEAATSALTKSGVGKNTTELIIETIRAQIAGGLLDEDPLSNHTSVAERIHAYSDAILSSKYPATAELIETCIKPYKHEVELDPEGREWEKGRKESIEALHNEIASIEKYIGGIRDTVGGSRKLKSVVQYIDDLEAREKQKINARRAAMAQRLSGASQDQQEVENELLKEDAEDPTRPAYNAILIQKAREARAHQGTIALLKARIAVLKSRQCTRYSEKTADDMRVYCPEAFLNIVADKLATTAVQFVNIELLQEYFHLLPRQIETQMGYNLTREEILEFARENPKFRNHLDLQDRKEKLELVSEKLGGLLRLQQERQGPIRHASSAASSARGNGNRRFGLF